MESNNTENFISEIVEQPVLKKKKIMPEIEFIIEGDDEEIEMPKTITNVIVNKGTKAGGKNTNYYGKKFEEKTDNETRLLEQGYEKIVLNKDSKYGYYLFKTFEDKTITFVSQNGLKEFIKDKYDIELFRCPDEAYIIEYKDGKNKMLILEKKEQRVAGSVDTKLLSGPIFREEYEEALEGKFEVVYAFCVSEYLQNKIMSNEKKYIIFNKLMKKHNIEILFGDDENYFNTFDVWFNNSL